MGGGGVAAVVELEIGGVGVGVVVGEVKGIVRGVVGVRQ